MCDSFQLFHVTSQVHVKGNAISIIGWVFLRNYLLQNVFLKKSAPSLLCTRQLAPTTGTLLRIDVLLPNTSDELIPKDIVTKR